MAGSDAEWRARQWAMTKLKDLNFQQAYIEDFNIPYWERVTETASVTGNNPQGLAITAFADAFPIRPSCPTYADWHDYVERFAKGHYGLRYERRQELAAALEQSIINRQAPSPSDAQALIALCPPAAQAGLQQAWENAQGDPEALLAWLDAVTETPC
jgi:hypothetical protein